MSAKPATSQLPHPLPPELADLIAQRFRLLAEPMRIRLLDRLRSGEASVKELSSDLGTSEQNVSKHLGFLLRAGVVGRRKQKNLACYAITDSEMLELCEAVCGTLARQHAELGELLETKA
jgi:DNA-binding transcriptional ArsR family regulator